VFVPGGGEHYTDCIISIIKKYNPTSIAIIIETLLKIIIVSHGLAARLSKYLHNNELYKP
jgi:hypothetical protein